LQSRSAAARRQPLADEQAKHCRGFVMSKKSWVRAGAALALGAALLSGCVVAPVGPYPGEVVAVAPPAPQVEVYGPAPAVGYVWIGGFWRWYGGRHVWVGGHWEAPRPGYHWVPHRWEPVRGGYRAVPGYWAR
jgi:hypothetical protein